MIIESYFANYLLHCFSLIVMISIRQMFHKFPIDIHVHQKTFMHVHELLLTRSFQGDAFESKQPKKNTNV